MKSRIRRIRIKSRRIRKLYGGRVPTNYVYSNTNQPVELWDVIEYINGTTSQGYVIQITDLNIFVHFPRMPLHNSVNTYSTITSISSTNGNILDESIYFVKRGTEEEYASMVASMTINT